MSRIIAAAIAAVCLFSLTSSPDASHAAGGSSTVIAKKGESCC